MSAAKFAATPAYFAHVMGSRQVKGVPNPAAPEIFQMYSLVTVPIIENPVPSGFVMQVFLLMFNNANQVVGVNPGDIPGLIPFLTWTIVWMGIEG